MRIAGAIHLLLAISDEPLDAANGMRLEPVAAGQALGVLVLEALLDALDHAPRTG
jgi:hypothetical protein